MPSLYECPLLTAKALSDCAKRHNGEFVIYYDNGDKINDVIHINAYNIVELPKQAKISFGNTKFSTGIYPVNNCFEYHYIMDNFDEYAEVKERLVTAVNRLLAKSNARKPFLLTGGMRTNSDYIEIIVKQLCSPEKEYTMGYLKLYSLAELTDHIFKLANAPPDISECCSVFGALVCVGFCLMVLFLSMWHL